MYPLIRIAFILLFLYSVAFECFAGTESVRPVKPASFSSKNIGRLDSLLNPAVLVDAKEAVLSDKNVDLSSSRICTCQILNLESSNYDHRSVVLLSEKTNDGSPGAYTAAKNRLLKEKKQLKKMFYDKIQVVSEFQGAGSCKSMFYRLHATDKNLQLYEILNAD
jgi:hypothetical protein